MQKILVAGVLMSGMMTGALGMRAQMAAAPGGAMAAGAAVEPSKAVDSMLTSFEGEFMSAARAMPADKYDFSPAALHIPGATFDGVRTFGQEVTHVAQANYSIYSGLQGVKPDVDVKALGTLKTKDEIVAAAAASFAYAHQAIATITVANANTALRAGRPETRETLGIYGAVHGFDHYGQMVEYLRMNGIAPPASAK